MKKRMLLLFVLICMLAVLLTTCLPRDGKFNEGRPAGFLWGIWLGWIAPVSLIVGLFRKGIRIYGNVNTGWWYEF